MNGTDLGPITFIESCKFLNDREEVIIKFPSNRKLREHIILLALGIILCLSATFLNGVATTAIWTCEQLKAKVSSFTILVKSIMDLAIAVVTFPLYITLLSREIGENPTCDEYFLSKKIGALFNVYSVTIMCMMNFDRYMAILHPITHRNKVTKQRLLKYTVLAMVLQIILFVFSIIEVKIVTYVLAATTLLLIATTVFVYARIFCSVRKATRNRKWKLKKELKLAGSSFLIVVCFLVCFLSATIAYINRLKDQPSFSLVVRRRRFALLSLLSTTLNPIIFFWRDKAMRTRGIALIKCHFFCR